MRGIHVFGELSGCDSSTLIDIDSVLRRVREIIDSAGLSRVSEAMHVFPNGGYTFVICLAESHLAVHTWVDERLVTLDVFMCNVTKDHSADAQRVFDEVSVVFHPEHRHVQTVER